MNPLFDLIARETQESGVLPFRRFMELALYCPVYGYYEAEKDNIGRRGDFFTSVSVGGLFGELLAFQFADWLGALPIAECRVPIVEAGAHDGQLARDILTWLRERRPDLFRQIQYCILEPSPRRQQRQQQTLAEFADHVRWFTGFADLEANRPSAIGHRQGPEIIFSNELLDAMPVHRLGWDAANRRWFEWGVAMDGDRFVWTKIQHPEIPSSLLQLPSSLLQILPDGFTTEICPAAEHWWRQAARTLRHGRLLTFDYGFEAEEFFAPERGAGTLRACSRHRQSDDPLANPGAQDLTAHVNFTAVRAAGEAAGLRTEALVRQEKFLTDIAARAWKPGAAFGEWTPARVRQFQTLTHPAHLGRAFRVLIQSRLPAGDFRKKFAH